MISKTPSPVLRALPLVGLLAVQPLNAQTPVVIGTDFQINEYTAYGQQHAAIAPAGGEGFVVVWQSSAQDGSGSAVVGRRVDAWGLPAGSELVVNAYTTGGQHYPAVAPDGSGFVVVWDSLGSPGSDADGTSVQAQQFTAAGIPVAGQFQVNTYTTGYQETAVVAAGDGTFSVVWHGSFQRTPKRGDNPPWEIVSQQFNTAGMPLGDERQINADPAGSQRLPSLAADGQGGQWVVWAEREAAGPDSDAILLRRVDSMGEPVGGDFQVNTFTTGYQDSPDVAVGAGGSFVVVWESPHEGGPDRVWGRRFASDGQPVGVEFAIQQGTEEARRPRLAADDEGGFLVVWQRLGGELEIDGRRLGSSGLPAGENFQVNAVATGSQRRPDLVYDGDRGFLVVWESTGAGAGDPDMESVRLGRVALDDDGDGVIDRRDCAPDDPTNSGPDCTVFEDGFESGDTTAWSNTVGG